VHHTTLLELAADVAADMEKMRTAVSGRAQLPVAASKKDDAASLHTKQHRLKVVSRNIVKILSQAEVPRSCRLGSVPQSDRRIQMPTTLLVLLDQDLKPPTRS